uniref:DUF4283 domain-containing protein n=1 Tax=Cannabis sativa TaxID=3483 RepID=A0A803QEQ8_CANSA
MAGRGRPRKVAQGSSKPKTAIKKTKKKESKSKSAVGVLRTELEETEIGIDPLELTEEEDENFDELQGRRRLSSNHDLLQPPLSPRSSLQEIKRMEEVCQDFRSFLHANEKCNSTVAQGKNSIPPILHSAPVVRNLENVFKSPVSSSKVKIDFEDIEDEVNFWKSSIVCYVLGSNPPLQILEGFAKRIWADMVDRVCLLAYGIFIIRFHSIEDRDKVVNGGYIFFNRRPVIMKPWDPNTNFRKEDVKNIPIWIQLEDLDLKYWGQKSLFKIVGQMENPIMVDEVTKSRDRLNYPRVLVEVKMDQELPTMLEFEDEHGMNTYVGVKYEWKPIKCTHCYGMGHGVDDCKKNLKPKQEWVVKEDKRKKAEKNIMDEEGFQQVTKGRKHTEQQKTIAETKNSFSVLADNTTINAELYSLQGKEAGNRESHLDEIGNTREGGGPSLVNG